MLHQKRWGTWTEKKKSFGGIPNSRNVSCLQIFLKASAGNPVEPDLALHQRFPKPSLGPFSETGWAWLGFAPSLPDLLRNLFRNPVELDLALQQSLPDLLRNLLGTLLNLTWASRNLLRDLLRNPVELDPALHQSLPDLLRNFLRNPVETFRTLLNLTWVLMGIALSENLSKECLLGKVVSDSNLSLKPS